MMPSSVSGLENSASSAAPAGAAAAQADALAQRDTFLKLLVAQLRYQDPLQPADAVQFVGQLAQFSQLEQLIEIRAELESLRQAVGSQPGAAQRNQGGK